MKKHRCKIDLETRFKRRAMMACLIIRLLPACARENGRNRETFFLYLSECSPDTTLGIASVFILGRRSFSAAVRRTDRPEASAFISRLFSSQPWASRRGWILSDSGGWLLECPMRLLYLLAHIITRVFPDAYLPFLSSTHRISFYFPETGTSAIIRSENYIQ